MTDFGAIYFGARCAVLHKDPYDPSTVLQEFKAEGGRFPVDTIQAKIAPIAITHGVNFPTSLFLAAPIALLPWRIAQDLWTVLTAGLLAVAAFSMWELGASTAQVISVCLLGFILANSEEILMSGNLAGVTAGLCVLAAWCFVRKRYELAGVLLLAISLVLKPHDSGFVWLYFLLSGGALRKRALQTLAVACILGLAAMVWIVPSSPRWATELHRNLATDYFAHGGVNDPSPSSPGGVAHNPFVNIQGAISIFRDDPRFYNPVSYLIAGSLILLWAFMVFRQRRSPGGALLALAAISPLSLLPVYHRPYDAKLLMLTIPACTMLWATRAPRRWLALALTSAGIFVTSDVPLASLSAIASYLSISTSTPTGRMMTVLLYRPAPLVLLVLGCFYLWAYAGYPRQADLLWRGNAAERPAAVADI
jgi:hypothetical protein